ncbi:MAG: hypothetical protein AAF733_07835, partial [Verrucomicrobiota bacterium]
MKCALNYNNSSCLRRLDAEWASFFQRMLIPRSQTSATGFRRARRNGPSKTSLIYPERQLPVAASSRRGLGALRPENAHSEVTDLGYRLPESASQRPIQD